MSLKDSVFESLNNSVENGYEMDSFTVQDLVTDLKTYDADLECVPEEDLMPLVTLWLENPETD